MDKTKLSINIFFACLLWIFARSQKMDDTNPDAKEATCNGCFLQICFPATCPDLSCIGQSIILPIACKDPPPWLFQSDIGSTILRWEEGSHWTMARWWNKVFKQFYLMLILLVFWMFSQGFFLKYTFWSLVTGSLCRHTRGECSMAGPAWGGVEALPKQSYKFWSQRIGISTKLGGSLK